MLLRELEERMKIIADNTRARVFSAGYNPRYYYPYGLQNASNARQSGRDSRYEMIIDSACNDDDVTNEAVIERAAELNADYVVPKDYPGDPIRTAESLLSFVSLYEEHPECQARPFAVIQPPYVEQYRVYESLYERFSYLALGGLLQYEPAEQVRMIREFREEVGEYTYLHAFGVGTHLEMIRALRENPRLIDSLDTSTAETAIAKNSIRDKMWTETPFYIPEGVDSTTVRARFSSAMLYMLNYMLGTRVDDSDLEAEYRDQTSLLEIAEMQDALSGDDQWRHSVSDSEVVNAFETPTTE